MFKLIGYIIKTAITTCIVCAILHYSGTVQIKQIDTIESKVVSLFEKTSEKVEL